MDALIAAQVTELIRKMGQSGDAAGIATLFAHLAKIEGYTDSVEGVLGTNADAPATNASIWAMLKTLSNKSAAIDITSLVPFGAELDPSDGNGVWKTALSITGKGFLNSFVVSPRSGSTTVNLKITVDDILKVTAQAVTAGVPSGFVQKSEISTNVRITGLSYGTLPAYTSFSPYPNTSGTPYFVASGMPIYFVKNLLLEYQVTGGTSYSYRYDGGYQP